MYRRDDPRLRRTLEQLSHNVESATEHAQENLYSFSQNYINPCLGSVGNCLWSCTGSCYPVTEDRRRKQRARSRGRAEQSFDFYDDWDEAEDDALLGWGNSSDQLDRLLAGSGSGSGSQPNRERNMNYGTHSSGSRGRRKSTAQIDTLDPNVIPSSNYLGFLERLPWGLGRKVIRYQPSTAGLQEHPGAHKPPPPEHEPLLEDSEDDIVRTSPKKKHKRVRSNTGTSGHTTDSLSSRGDLFPSDDEADAIPLDDEFANILERRTTNDDSSGKSRTRPTKSGSRVSIRTVSSRSTKSELNRKASSSSRKERAADPPTITELKAQEEQVQEEEEEKVTRKREKARRLAIERGLSSGAASKSDTRSSSPMPEMTDIGSKSPSSIGTVPFPTFESPTGLQTPRSDSDVRLEPTLEDYVEENDLHEPPELDTLQLASDEQAFTPAALPRFR